MANQEHSGEAAHETQEAQGLGTFAGVFTPSVLTILGIILFLRLGFVVGNAGLGVALAVILLANLISVLTSFSLAAIATNFKVRGGGDYYLISRTLGPEFGGAIGLVLFLAQSVSVAFYAIGFAEGVTAMIDGLDARLVAGAALLPLFLMAWVGADWATRFQYVIMVVLTLAIGAFFIGGVQAFDTSVLADNWKPSGELTFWAIFALFFPAVTGFTQGVSMSGELRDPARSLPSGTFAAVGISIVIYVAGAVLFAGALPGAELVGRYDSMNQVALVPGLITAGIFAATLSSALASFLGAPRILQALASDRLFGFLTPFAKGHGAAGNPRRAVLLSFGIAVATVAVGDLNVVAPIVSMFFLISYGLLNYATYYEASTSSPSFRPRFRWYHARVSLLGCVACGGAMVAIDPLAGALALGVLLAIHQYLARASGPDRWADASRSALFQRARGSLYAMDAITEHERDWRPVILAFSDDGERRAHLLRFASWIEGGSGFTSAVRLVQGEGIAVRRESAQAEEELAAELRAAGLQAFARVFAVADPEAAFPTVLQAHGIGPIRPNVALFNWFDREETAESAPAMRSYSAHLRTALRHRCNVVVLAARGQALERLGAAEEGTGSVDVWWRGDACSKVALLLAYLLTRQDPWTERPLRVLGERQPDTTAEESLEALRKELEEMRIPGEALVLDAADWDAVRTASTDTALAFVTFRVHGDGLLDASGAALPISLEGLPPMALVAASEEIDLEAHPDEGSQAEAARAQDASAEADARAEKVRERAQALSAKAKSAAERLAALEAAGAAAEELDPVRAELEKAEAEAAEAMRKVAKAEAKALEAAHEAAE